MNGLLSASLSKFKAAQAHVEEAARMEGEIARLEALVYVPGYLVCKKCGFGLSKRTIFMASGTIGANEEPDHCPNDGAPLWRVAERDMREEQFKELLKIRNRTLEDVAVMADEVLLKAFAEKVRDRKTEEG